MIHLYFFRLFFIIFFFVEFASNLHKNKWHIDCTSVVNPVRAGGSFGNNNARSVIAVGWLNGLIRYKMRREVVVSLPNVSFVIHHSLAVAD